MGRLTRIAVITATRAEFGLLMPVIRELREYERNDFIVELVVTGTHLINAFGHTVDEILSFGFRVDEEIKVKISTDTAMDISRSQADTLIQFTDLFIRKGYNAIVILGDRYELMGISIAAQNTATPIVHIGGGDISETTVDSSIRDCVTKMSVLHFPTNELSKKKIIQLGEDPKRVFNYGSTGVDNALQTADMEKSEALNSIGIYEDCDYALCTYHPTTLEEKNYETIMDDLLYSIQCFQDVLFIFTKSNADRCGERINQILDREEKRIKNLHVFSSLGVRRYLSLMRHAKFVLGNSSSGLLETPIFKKPTVNIGDRQRGRLHSCNIIDCQENKDSIVSAIEMAMSSDFKKMCEKNTVNPYGFGDAGVRIAKKIVEFVNATIDIKKGFYWIDE